jgi:hypothetical protein
MNGTRGVIAGLDPAIHDDFSTATIERFVRPTGVMDGRVKPGRDSDGLIRVQGQNS